MSKDKPEPIVLETVSKEPEAGKPPLGVKERFDLEDVTDLFEFIQKVAFPGMPLEMVAILSAKDIGVCMRLYYAILLRKDLEDRYPILKGKTQLRVYITLLREYLRFSVSKEGEARQQLMETAIAGLPRKAEERGFLGRKK